MSWLMTNGQCYAEKDGYRCRRRSGHGRLHEADTPTGLAVWLGDETITGGQPAREGFTGEQDKQLAQLRHDGWTIEITDRDPEGQMLIVRGTEPNGDRYRGTLDYRGVLVGEPVDAGRAPEKFGVAAP